MRGFWLSGGIIYHVEKQNAADAKFRVKFGSLEKRMYLCGKIRIMEQIKFDKRNYRKHNDENKRVIKKSLKELGAGRSIVIDNTASDTSEWAEELTGQKQRNYDCKSKL